METLNGREYEEIKSGHINRYLKQSRMKQGRLHYSRSYELQVRSGAGVRSRSADDRSRVGADF